MMKSVFIWIFVLLPIFNVYGTHERAGEITYKQITDYTFEFTITTFTYTLSPVDREGLEIGWGDNSYSVAPRVSKLELPDFYRKNTYVIRHTFPGPGTYKILMEDPTRNAGVLNIPNSVNVIFSVATTMVINPQLGINNTPVMLNYPVDKAALHKTFIHNPSAFDSDGDSISYSMAVCLKENGTPIDNYTLPEASDTIYVNPVNGDFVWDSPEEVGIYNIAMNIGEWRNGVKINNIVRDMQVEVVDTKNNPPVNQNIQDICVLAGDSIHIEIISTDADNDKVTQTATGGPFIMAVSPASFSSKNSVAGSSTSVFRWQTTCDHVRKQPYSIVIKAEDNNTDVKLVDIDNFNIRILAPGPERINTSPGNNTITVKWSQSPCKQATGYIIYRSTTPVSNVTDSCEGGIKEGLGYQLVGYATGIKDTMFVDNNKGAGLTKGISYCYRVVAVFEDGAKSYPSGESCATLVPGVPALMNASVNIADPSNGEVYVSWIKPRNLNTIPASGPYEYIISRTDNLQGTGFNMLTSIQTTDLMDTFHMDKSLNTLAYPYMYRVELYNNEPGNRFLIGESEVASTMYPELLPSDNQVIISFARNVPWLNDEYVIYRLNNSTSAYDSIGFTNTESYTDSGLANGQQVCYKIKSYGHRELNGVYTNTNWSHIACTTPVDTMAPCVPLMNVNSICDSARNVLTWNFSGKECLEDVVSYKIYYKSQLDAGFNLLTEISNKTDTSYVHFITGSLAGCYAISAIDSFFNESEKSTLACVDNCAGYDIPNRYYID